MKKLISLLLALIVCTTLCACNGNASAIPTPTEDILEPTSSTTTNTLPTNPPAAETLLLSNTNSVANYADFTLYKVLTTSKVTASIAESLFYENTIDGETFVDVVFDWTNTSTETINSSDIVFVSAKNSNGVEYTASLYAVETNNATCVSQYENIAPLSTVRLHCAISIPKTETDLVLKVDVNGTIFEFDYVVGETQRITTPLAVGDSIEKADYATVLFNGIEYADDVLPSDTSSSYSHFEIDSSSNTYLVVKLDITNSSTSEKSCDSFVGVKATYMDKYTYSGFAVVEDEDGKGINAFDTIIPLSTRHLYYLIEVPKSVIENNVELTLSFGGQEYIYTA